MKSGVNKNQDKLQEILRQKLEGHESQISNNLWASIENQLPKASGAASATAAKTWGLTQWVVTAAVVAGVSLGALYFSTQEKKENSVAQTEVLPSTPEANIKEAQPDSTKKITTQSNDSSIGATPQPTVADLDDSEFDQSEKASAVDNLYLGAIDQTTIENQVGSNENEESGRQGFIEEEAPVPTIRALSGKFHAVAANKENLLFLFIPEDGTDESYEWNFGDDKTSHSSSPNHSYTEEGNYEVVLKVTDQNGRVKQSKETICVYRPGKIKAPNAFSPGNDGKNDVFDLRDLSSNIASYIELSILDSNGRIIFTNYDEPTWNGLDMAGIQCQPGAYSFIAKATDNCGVPIVKAGPIQLFAR